MPPRAALINSLVASTINPFQKGFHSLVYFVVEFGDAFMCPVFSKLRQNMTQSIRPVGEHKQHSKSSHLSPALFNKSHLVMVPSMSEMTMRSSQFHR